MLAATIDRVPGAPTTVTGTPGSATTATTAPSATMAHALRQYIGTDKYHEAGCHDK
jgi:hypothetical protein